MLWIVNPLCHHELLHIGFLRLYFTMVKGNCAISAAPEDALQWSAYTYIRRRLSGAGGLAKSTFKKSQFPWIVYACITSWFCCSLSSGQYIFASTLVELHACLTWQKFLAYKYYQFESGKSNNFKSVADFRISNFVSLDLIQNFKLKVWNCFVKT